MDKAHIVAEIQRTAAANGGQPLGFGRFKKETGINKHDWYGKHWVRWNDAVVEAGFSPNQLIKPFDDAYVIETLAKFIQALGHFPVEGEIRMRSREDDTFPSYYVFNRVGLKAELAAKVIDYCSQRDGLEAVAEICRPIAAERAATETVPENSDNRADLKFGHVYLFRSGKHYKIGHSNSAGRREYELAIQLPEKLTAVHTISTDDPVGIEDYWHRRFAIKRLNGEWFSLDATDIRAFKRRKFM
jgi:hypothetical protein